jgi:hypothetical protein
MLNSGVCRVFQSRTHIKILVRDEQIVKVSISHGLMATFQLTIIEIS